MKHDQAIVNPIAPTRQPSPARKLILVSNDQDLEGLRQAFMLRKETCSRLFTSRVYTGQAGEEVISLAGPFIGSPYAVMLLEVLVAWGVEVFVLFGWCGAISPDVIIGDLVVPSAAIVDEGTSGHYHKNFSQQSALPNGKLLARPSPEITAHIISAADGNDLTVHHGTIWTTDAVFRETHEKVSAFRKGGVLGVEMESSALFTVAAFRGVDIGALFVVSDELGATQWRPGFRNKIFKENRRKAYQTVVKLCRKI